VPQSSNVAASVRLLGGTASSIDASLTVSARRRACEPGHGARLLSCILCVCVCVHAQTAWAWSIISFVVNFVGLFGGFTMFSKRVRVPRCSVQWVPPAADPQPPTRRRLICFKL
jgi:cell division protein FtsW (lipid II flippase)